MEVQLFQNSPTGTVVPIWGQEGGREWDRCDFLPYSLGTTAPERAPAEVRAVADERAALASLDATAQRLHNPRLFRNFFLRIEAQATAALEGTYEPLLKVLGSEPQGPESVSMR